MNRFYTISLSFLAGSLVPATALYLTGGSNRFNFLFGLSLGLALVLLPLLLWPKSLSQKIWSLACAWEQFLAALHTTSTLASSSRSNREPKSTPHSQVLEESIKKDEPVEPVKESPAFAGDVVSALINLHTAQGKSQKIVNELVAKKEYEGFDPLFKDAVQVLRTMKAGGR